MNEIATDRCPNCHRPTHASESNEDGVCRMCVIREYSECSPEMCDLIESVNPRVRIRLVGEPDMGCWDVTLIELITDDDCCQLWCDVIVNDILELPISPGGIESEIAEIGPYLIERIS